MSFTRDYFSHPSVIVALKGSDPISSFENVHGKRVAGVKDFAITVDMKNKLKDSLNHLNESLQKTVTFKVRVSVW